MTDFEKLRKEIATKIEAAYSRPFEEQAEAVMAVILAELQEPTKKMLRAKNVAYRGAYSPWPPMLNASPLVKP